MRSKLLLLIPLLAMSLSALAQKQVKEHKEKKVKGNFVIILPVINATNASGEQAEIEILLARAGLLKAFNERKFDIVSPAEVNATLESTHIDPKQTTNWTPENLDKLADAWTAKFVAGVVIQTIAVQKDPQATAKTPQTYTVNVGLSAWLYDVKNHKFLMEDVKSAASKQVKQPKDQKVDEKQLVDVTVEIAAEGAFKDFLSHYRKTAAQNKLIS